MIASTRGTITVFARIRIATIRTRPTNGRRNEVVADEAVAMRGSLVLDGFDSANYRCGGGKIGTGPFATCSSTVPKRNLTAFCLSESCARMTT